MGRYLKEAQGHAEQIAYYYDNAGHLGHQQAEYYFNKLCGLPNRAGASKNDKADVESILSILKKAREKMQEMARRRDEWLRAQQADPDR